LELSNEWPRAEKSVLCGREELFMPVNLDDVLNALGRVAPGALDVYRQAIGQGGALFELNGITTPLRMAHFLAQALEETGGLRILREDMDYRSSRISEVFGVGHHSASVTPDEAFDLAHKPKELAERVYGLGNPKMARDLGNTEPDDGFRYRGNGLLQTTGRAAHREAGQAFGVDFENNPDLVTTVEHALQPALHEWTKKNLNDIADRSDIRTITVRINGGFNGFDDRQMFFEKIFPLLQPGADLGLVGIPDDDVRSLQRDLNTLGANPKLDVDGRYGPNTRAGVKNFQAAAGIKADGIAGPVTKATIKLMLDRLR
jgi:putative chitinase